jgi:hypothetical protein
MESSGLMESSELRVQVSEQARSQACDAVSNHKG